ncbi:MAG: hypothetical protein MUP98_01465, partial [Candidatus Aminicenantes bacterium]|nr:hypothetical protein [Candidatus Aminicenantes bacterium]
MNCNWFDKYDQGKIKKELFQEHAKECPACQEKALKDEELLFLSRSLKKNVDAPFLWTRIEHDLREAQRLSKKMGWKEIIRYSWKKFPVTALLIIALCGGLYLWFRPGLHDSTLLADSALRRIEKREQRYEKSIEKLQGMIFPQLEDLEWELRLLYRDRMETIDEQILACKEALRENPGNTHIRKYMLAAFQDKKSTLKEIMET